MLIYIRHSHDEGHNQGPRHDHDITKKGKSLAKEVGKKLLDKYGLPTIIFCSPFLRTRKTLKYILKNLDENDIKSLNIIYDNNLARYFSKREQEDPSVLPETLKFDIPIQESNSDFHQRVDEHIAETKKQNYLSSDRVYWVITHALIYKRVAKHYEITIPERIPFMHYFKLHDKAAKAAKAEKTAKAAKCSDCGKRH